MKNPFQKQYLDCYLFASILLTVCTLSAQAQLYFTGLVSGVNMKSFGQYADWINQDPLVISKLETFHFTYGYSTGLDLNNGVPGFNFRQSYAHATMEHAIDGVINYDLRFSQYLLPMNLVYFNTKNGVKHAHIFSLIAGIGSTKIIKSYEALPNSEAEYKATNVNFGPSYGHVWTRGSIGLLLRVSYIGNILVRYDDQSSLSYKEYYLKYRYEGEDREVKADTRSLNLEIGLYYLFVY